MDDHWHSLDRSLAVTGPFRDARSQPMTSQSQIQTIQDLPTKRISKRYLLKQRGERAIALLL